MGSTLRESFAHGVTAIREGRIPYRFARRISRVPTRSLFWRCARAFYTRALVGLRLTGLFPLPVEPTPYTRFPHLQFRPVRDFPAGERPRSISGAGAWARWTSDLPEHMQERTIRSCHTVLVRRGFADADGNVFSPDGYLIVGASSSVRNCANDYYLPSRLFPRIYGGGTVAALTSSVQGNYYHWLSDVLPRIHMVRAQQLGPDRFYVRTKHAFQSATLSLLGLGDERIVSADEYDGVRAETLLVPFHEIKPASEYPAWVYDFLRESFLPRVDAGPAVPSERIYVSRAAARWRRVENEPEVLDRLRPLGFRPVTLDGMPFLEQVRLFHAAAAVIAPHGAGLANLVFSPRGAKVIELQPTKLQNPFFKLSRTAGLDYYYVTSATGPAEPVNNHQQITIDMGELDRTLALAALL